MPSGLEVVKRGSFKRKKAVSQTRSGFTGLLMSSPTKIWKSKISWRIAITAFMTILLVQTVVLNMGLIDTYEKERLYALEEQARNAVAMAVDPDRKDIRFSPFSDRSIERLLRVSPLSGLAVYSYKFDFIQSYGAAPILSAEIGKLDQHYRSVDGSYYEVILKGSDIQSIYTVVVRLDATSVSQEVFYYVIQNIVIMCILSLLVTNVLMIALGKWLLEPILFMRENLMAASKNPEAPDILPSPYGTSDEIGVAIELSQKLIRQNAENITHIKSTAEDKIHKLAFYDTLTGLPNRALFIQKLSENARTGDDNTHSFAVIALDLDHFKDINDSMGHNVGDAILRSVGKKLRAALPETAIVSRTGEDEFALMVPLTEGGFTARDVAERLIGVIRAEPFKVFNEEFQVRASIGLATYPHDGAEPDMVLKNADIALNRAKEEGRDTIKEYSEDFDRAVQERFQMLRDLRDALEHDQLQLHYQPQLDLKTGQVIGAEALLRWWKPDHSKEGGRFISPVDFIPVAEQSGLIVPIGQWVIKKACETAMICRREHGIDIRFAVNVSGNQFIQGDICNYVAELLRKTGLPPQNLELEVTESVFMDDIQHTVQILHNLHSLGVELAIDDFGTGYSSLSYLSQFPIDRLKIDQSFVRQALNDNENASIARTIINLGHSLNLKVIAEGVETRDHEAFLVAQGCDEAQGYRYSRPVPQDALIDFIKAYDGKLGSFDQ